MERPAARQPDPALPAGEPADGAGRRPAERLLSRPREESEAAPMRFRLGTHGDAFAEGTITPGDGERLRRIPRRASAPAT